MSTSYSDLLHMACCAIKRSPGAQDCVRLNTLANKRTHARINACMHVCVIVHMRQEVISLLTGRRGVASLRCLPFSPGEGAAPGGSLCTEIPHQSGRSLPGPTGERRGRRENSFICSFREKNTNNDKYLVERYRSHGVEEEEEEDEVEGWV